MEVRELLALLLLYSRCLDTVNVLWLFLAVLWVGLRSVILIFPYHTHFLILWLSGLESTNCLSEWETGKTLIRLLSEKHSDLGRASFSRPVLQLLVFEILEPS